jgi:hypothetical protein
MDIGWLREDEEGNPSLRSTAKGYHSMNCSGNAAARKVGLGSKLDV